MNDTIYIVCLDNMPYMAFKKLEDAKALVTSPNGEQISEIWPTKLQY